MINVGAALSVMGNHEFNAISYFTKGKNEEFLRKHSENNIKQHKVFLEAYETNYAEWEGIIEWFKTLPLWLDLGELRVVHACWDNKYIKEIESLQNMSNLLSKNLLHAASNNDTWQYKAIDTLLKGKEIALPEGYFFRDKDGTPRKHIRVKWWNNSATTYQGAFLGPESAITHIPDDPIPGDHLIEYTHVEKPLFIGHYCLEGNPRPLASNIACLDYSVAHNQGKLVAYKWDGEVPLKPENFISVNKSEIVSPD